MLDIRPAHEFESGEPGLYANVPDKVYHAFDACSNSRLSKLNISPAHCRAAMDQQFADTPALQFGRAAHMAVLEPKLYAERYTVAGQCSAELKKGGTCTNSGTVRIDGDWFCGIHRKALGEPDQITSISESDGNAIGGMVAVLNSHRAASKILSLPGHTELSALWIHEDTGQLCKMRIDKYATSHDVLVDYKTTTDASPDSFERSVYKWGYHRQGAFYLEGMRSLGVNMRDFVLISQEKDAPYAAAVMRITNAALEAGRSELDRLVARYAECAATGDWPGYDDTKIHEVDLPEWAYRRIYDQELDESVPV